MTARSKKKQDRDNRSSKKTIRRVIAALCLVTVMGAAGASGGAYWLYTRPGPLSAPTAIVIPHGGYASTIRTLQGTSALPEGQVAASVFQLAILITRKEGQIHAAELLFPAHGSMRDVLYVLRHGQPVRHPITIPEGLTSKEIVALINAAPFLQGDTPPFAEGDVLPQTYDYLRDTSRAALVARMKAAMTRMVASVWASRDPAFSLTTPAEMVTLASIVEKETGLPEERPHIARVFLNRLKLNMRLQSDPTTIYALNDGAGPLGRALTHADLAISSPYNTYAVTGLPPGPICAPGQAALEAVAHPAPGDDLYFVASGTGGHKFAATLDEHNRNVAAWRGALGPEHK